MSFLRLTDDPVEAVASVRGWLAADEPPPAVIETSGSTGEPKRVVLSRRAVLASAAASRARMGAEGRWLLALPASYVAGFQVMVRSLLAGDEPVVVGASFAGAVAKAGQGPLFASFVPTQLHRLLDDPHDLAGLRELHTILVGGGPVPQSLRDRAAAEGLRVVATYGATETAGGCVYDGLPLDGVAVAIGERGRIRIGGTVLFDEYDGDPELTARDLVDGWFLTEDAGRFDEHGRLEVLGRLDDVVVSGGVNVPGGVVAARLREHPEVEAAEVVGLPDPEWGHRVVAFVVGPVSLAEARDWVAQVHPRAWAPREVVAVDALPMLASGKVDRTALRSLR